jgi:CubicO group peptidase (beta-lactamase class C family)
MISGAPSHGRPASRAGPGLVVLALTACSLSPNPAIPDETALDAVHFGHPDSVLFWTPDQELAGFRNYDLIFPTRTIRASEHPFPLPERIRDLSGVLYEVDGATFDLAAFRAHNHIAGLLVIKDGGIAHEEYDLGNGPETKWVSYSVAKSVVSMLVGAALRDGYIASVDDSVTEYVPVLRGSSYAGVKLRDVLRMASGVRWNEDYTDPRADVSKEIPLTTLERLRYYAALPRVAPPGSRFNYSTGETNLVGAVLRGAIGNNLSTYLERKIWQPFGMESDANWMLVEPGGAEHGGCCLSATLRDYGRIGMFALRRGVLQSGEHVLPDDWMGASTTPSPANDGYGYLWWLRDGDVYSAQGIFGQAIIIDPDQQLIMVTHSVWPTPTDRDLSAHRDAFFAAVREALRS